jgi:hypothetical protein
LIVGINIAVLVLGPKHAAPRNEDFWGGIAVSAASIKAFLVASARSRDGKGFLEGPRIAIAGLGMSLLPRKGVLAITAVIDVALNARNGPLNSRALAKNQRLGPRYLESELQALVREGILKAIRGPHTHSTPPQLGHQLDERRDECTLKSQAPCPDRP